MVQDDFGSDQTYEGLPLPKLEFELRCRPTTYGSLIVLFGPTLAAMCTCVLKLKQALKKCKHSNALL